MTIEKCFVAVLMSDPKKLLDDEKYYGPMLRELSEALLAKNIMMRPVQCLHEHQKQHFLLSPEGMYSGIVALGQMYKHKEFVEAVVRRMPGPKVMLDHHFDDIAMHSVREDALAGMRTVTEHMLSLGHRHIAYLDMDRPDGNPWKREGLNLALRQAGRSQLAPGWIAGCRMNFSDVSAALDWFLDLEPRPTGIVCCDDDRALHLLQAAAEQGLRVPDDLSITGYGDTAVTTGRSHILTSVAFASKELGRKAAELVCGPEDAKPISILVTPDLVPRGSTAEPAGR